MYAHAQVPNAQQVAELSGELRSRAALPPHVTKVLAALPPDTHPMTQLSTAVLSLQASRSDSRHVSEQSGCHEGAGGAAGGHPPHDPAVHRRVVAAGESI